VLINAKGISGGQAEISGQISSQFLSALLMTGPLSRDKIVLKIKDELMSAPYVHMTMNLMKKFGIIENSDKDMLFEVSPGQYKSPGTYFIEGLNLKIPFYDTLTIKGCNILRISM